MDPREAAIQAAISNVVSGVFTSQRAAAKAYNIPRSTLAARLRGTRTRQFSHEYQQRLTPQQEEFLVQWILEEDARAFPPSHARAREMANRILRMNGDNNPVGKRWISFFLKRNTRVASIVGRKIEGARAEGATQEQIRAFLELFERTRVRLGIRTEDMWNMDETGKAMGVCANTRVLADSRKSKAYKQSPENREWASIIECVSATGKKLRCGVIFKGKNLQSNLPPWAASNPVGRTQPRRHCARSRYRLSVHSHWLGSAHRVVRRPGRTVNCMSGRNYSTPFVVQQTKHLQRRPRAIYS
ncbi:CENP-B protein [Alternaria alternata]|nr:CENP-B protein [Alternaria alternata]